MAQLCLHGMNCIYYKKSSQNSLFSNPLVSICTHLKLLRIRNAVRRFFCDVNNELNSNDNNDVVSEHESDNDVIDENWTSIFSIKDTLLRMIELNESSNIFDSSLKTNKRITDHTFVDRICQNLAP